MDSTYILTIDTPVPGLLTFKLRSVAGVAMSEVECAYSGPVDNLLLTTVDNLLEGSRVDRFALIAVELGEGIDKASSLYRIVQSFAAAIAAAR